MSRQFHVRLVTCSRHPEGDPETRDLAGLLNARGIRCDVQPWDADIEWGGAHLSVIRSAWDYHRHLHRFLGWTEAVSSRTSLWNSATLVRWNAHKGYLLDLEARGIPIVPTHVITRGDHVALTKAITTLDDDVVVKHAVSLDGEGMLRVHAGESGARAGAHELVDGADVLVQPFVESVAAEGEMSVVYIDGVFAHAVRKCAADGEFRVQERYGGRTEPASIDEDFLSLAERVTACIPEATLYARVDMVRWAGRPCLGELELIEPSLYLRAVPASSERFVTAIVARLRSA